MIDAKRRAVMFELLPASFALAGMLVSGPTGAAPTASDAGALDDKTRTWLRLVGDLSGRPTYAVERGDVWGFKPQADDLTTEAFARRLYGYWSLVARQIEPDPGGTVTLRTKAWTFYLHPQTGEIVTETFNPYTNEMVSCPPLSGPVHAARFGGQGPPAPLDLRIRRLGEQAWVEIDRVARFKPADTAWFKLEADLVSHACRAAALDRPGDASIPSTWSHNVVAEWQTWMKMHGTPGHILFKGDGGFIADLGAAPAPLRAAIERHFPTSTDEWKPWH